MSTEDREVTWAEAAEISKRTLLEAEARRSELADREAAAATDINLLDKLDIGDEDTDFGRGYARAQRDLAAAGWLPPDEAERLRTELDKRAPISLERYRELNEWAKWQANARDGWDERARKAERELAAVQPVIDAARALNEIIDHLESLILAESARRHLNDEAGRAFWQRILVQLRAFEVAVDALDANSPPEGPTPEGRQA